MVYIIKHRLKECLTGSEIKTWSITFLNQELLFFSLTLNLILKHSLNNYDVEIRSLKVQYYFHCMCHFVHVKTKIDLYYLGKTFEENILKTDEGTCLFKSLLVSASVLTWIIRYMYDY